MSTKHIKNALYPKIFGKFRNSNSLSGVDSSTQLWQALAREGINAVRSRIAPLAAIGFDIRDSVPDYGTPGHPAIVNVEQITGIREQAAVGVPAASKFSAQRDAGTIENSGNPLNSSGLFTDYFPNNNGATTSDTSGYVPAGALINAIDWQFSAWESQILPAALNRYSCPFALTINQIEQGLSVKTRIEAAISSVVGTVAASLYSWLDQTTGTLRSAEVDTSTTASADKPAPLGASIAANVSGMLMPAGVKALVLSPSAYAKLIPTSGLSLTLSDGVFGVDRIYMDASIPSGVVGYAFAERSLPMVVAPVPRMDVSGLAYLSYEDLGDVEGIPLTLKTWADPGMERIWHSVETCVGFGGLGTPSGWTQGYVSEVVTSYSSTLSSPLIGKLTAATATNDDNTEAA